MAKSAGKKASNLVVWIILILLIVGLAGFGARNFGGGVSNIGTVGDTEIPVDRYANALQSELQRIRQQTGQNLSFAEAKQFGLDQAVLRDVVAVTALEDETDRIGLSVGDATVREDILDIPAFQSLEGNFDREAYRSALKRAGRDVATFEARIRSDAARRLLERAVTGGIRAPAALTDTLFTYARESRDFTWAQLGADDMTKTLPDPSDEDLQAYYDAHEDAYTLPERRKITYAWVTPEMVADKVEVDEKALRDLYQSRIDDYVKPERRLVERLVFGSEDEAAKAKDAIESGETSFDALVEERGLTLDDTDIGTVTEEDLGQAGEAVFGLDGTGIAGPATSSLGPALFRVNAVLQPQETPFEEARPELRKELAGDDAERRISGSIEELENLLAGGATLEEIAEETDLELGEILWSDHEEDGIAGYDAFRKAASEAQVGDFPQLTELSDGGLFALRLDEIVEPELQPFDAVRDQVVEAWTQQERGKRLAARAEEIVGADAPLEDQGLELHEETGLTRDAAVDGAPVPLVPEAFEMSEGETRVVDMPGGAVILRLDAVAAPDPDTEEAKGLRERFAQRAGQEMSQEALDAFTAAVQTREGLQLNQSAVNAVNAQFR